MKEKQIGELQHITKKFLDANRWKNFKEKRAKVVEEYI